jgi:hypothetical protein
VHLLPDAANFIDVLADHSGAAFAAVAATWPGSPRGVVAGALRSHKAAGGENARTHVAVIEVPRSPLMAMSSSKLSPQSVWRGRQRAFLLTADQHRRMATLLRRGTAPSREEQARHHEQLAESIDRREQWYADIQRPTAAIE